MAESLKKKAFKGVFWKIGEQGARQVIALTIGVVLARLVAPSQFGAIAMLTIFTAIAGTFIDSGFSQALMRKQDRTQADCCTVFYFNIVVSIIAYVILFLIAPWVSKFYNMPILCPLMRVLSFTIVIGSISGVQGTLFSATLRFDILVKYTIIAQVISGLVGIAMAYKGMQVWAIVGQQYCSVILNSIFLWCKAKWRPSWTFSVTSLKEFFGFGSKMLASYLLGTIYENLYYVFIGKFYNATDLAYYNRAQNQKNLISSTPTGILQSVTYPTLCKLTDDDVSLRNGYRRTLRVSTFVIFPLCMGMGAIAYPFINVLYTDIWIEAATLLNIMVFSAMWYPIHAINLNLLIVKGRSDLFFRLEVIKKILGVTFMIISIPLGLKAICYFMIPSSLISLAINTWYTRKLINLGLWIQLKDLSGILILSFVMYAIVKAFTLYMGNGVISLIGGILIGILIYVSGSILFKFPELKELLNWKK